jgi:hypothetical protein
MCASCLHVRELFACARVVSSLSAVLAVPFALLARTCSGPTFTYLLLDLHPSIQLGYQILRLFFRKVSTLLDPRSFARFAL